MGLKQGDPSSPLMFMMFINDMVDNIIFDLENIFTVEQIRFFMFLYADYDIEIYCGIWNLKINTNKLKAMIIERGRHTNCELYLNNVKLEVVTSFKYLCVYFV